MPETVLPFSRGGMCANPFGGEDRIDRINLLEFLEPGAPPDKVLYCCIIQDAVSNYLYAFLGKNGTSAEEFFAAWQYFFKVVSTDEETWKHNRTVKQSYTRKGQRVTNNRYLTDNELKLMCFDKHYENSGLSEYMHIDKFRQKLKDKRRKILTNNWQQVTAYINALYEHELSQIENGQQVPLQVWNEDLLTILVDPPTPYHLANIIYVPNKLKRPRRKTTRRQSSNAGVYQKLAERLESNKIPALGSDWGPLSALLEGASNAEAISHNGSGSVPGDSTGHSATT